MLPLVYTTFLFYADSLIFFAVSAERFGFRFPCETDTLFPTDSAAFTAVSAMFVSTDPGVRISVSLIFFHLFCHLHVLSTRFSLLKPFSLPTMTYSPFLLSSHIAFQPLCLLCLRSSLRTLTPTFQL